MLTEKCTGCMACFNICKYSAIDIIQNEKGFYVPKINEEKCKKCGACEFVCPECNEIKKDRYKKIFAAWSNSNDVRKNSTSGGIFFELAKSILYQNGIVVGAIYNEQFEVEHSIIDKFEDLKKIQGSKYVQSKMTDIYSRIKCELEKGKNVLFSGVACQVAGLKKYLGKDYENLITIDVLCHGAPSPQIFKEYVDRKKSSGDILNIRFRYKKPSWTVFSMRIDYKDNKIYQRDTFKDEYIRLFLDDYITNEVCATCKYTGENRVSDLTLADFWGYVSEDFKYRNNEKGISLVLINSRKGDDVFNKIKKNLIIIEKDFSEAKNGNQCLRKPFNKNKNYETFWDDYIKNGYDYVIEKYFIESKMNFKRKLSLTFNDYAFIIPKKIRYKLIEIRTKSK